MLFIAGNKSLDAESSLPTADTHAVNPPSEPGGVTAHESLHSLWVQASFGCRAPLGADLLSNTDRKPAQTVTVVPSVLLGRPPVHRSPPGGRQDINSLLETVERKASNGS